MKLLHQLKALRPYPTRLGLFWLLLCLGLGGTLVQAKDPNRVGLVIADGETVVTRCVEFTEDEISGYDVLARSGLEFNAEVTGGMGAAICRLDGKGCSYPAEDCFCECQSNLCIFWSYWHLNGNDWEFSALGVSNRKVSHGQVEGWAWGEGSPGGEGAKPPVIPFAEICTTPPTATNTPTPTYTPQPTATPTPEPTSTPTSVATPLIHHFSADQITITAGQSVQLSWDLSNAEAAFLRYNDQEEGVVAPGSKIVSPTASTVYTLIAKKQGSENRVEVRITVNQPPTPTSTATATATAAAPPTTAPAQVAATPMLAPTAPPSPTLTAVTEQGVTITATLVPEPIINFSAASTMLPSGSCTTLQWEVQQANVAFIDNSPVALQGVQEVCPAQTQTFRLRAVYPGGETLTELILTVATPTVPMTNAQIEQPSATAVAAVVSPATQVATPVEPSRGTAATDSTANPSMSIWWIGAVIVVTGLFVVAPLALITVGLIVWSFKGNRRRRPR